MDTDIPETPFSEAFDIGRSLSHGWASLKRCFPVLFVGGCLQTCTEGGGNGGGGGNFGGRSRDSDHSSLLGDLADHVAAIPGRLLESFHHARAGGGLFDDPSDLLFAGLGAGALMLLLVGILALVVILLVFRAWFLPGWYRLHRQIVETGEGTFGVLFSGVDRFVHMLGWLLLKGVVTLGTLIAGALPGGLLVGVGLAGDISGMTEIGLVVMGLGALATIVYVGLGLALGDMAVALDDHSPMDALSRSWSLASGNRVSLFFYLFVTKLAQLVFALSGICALLIGALITVPSATALQELGMTESYLIHTRKRSEVEGWSIWQWAA